MMRHLANAGACLFAAGCVATSPLRSAGFTETLTASVNLPAAPRGTLLIVGGGSQPNQLVKQFVDLAGGRGKARIAILPMATSAAAEAGAEKEAINHLLTGAIGGSAVLRAIHERHNAGAVVGGTSAGAAVMSDSMITGNLISVVRAATALGRGNR